MNLLIRTFSSSSVSESTTDTYSCSRYFPFPMKHALFKLSGPFGCIRSDDYILCPLYDDNAFQIGVTGTVEEKEQFEHAMMRELGEEIGVVPTKLNKLKIYNWQRHDKPDTEFHVYYTNLQSCLAVDPDKHGESFSQNSDRNDQKVGCFIYGDIDEIKSFLSQEKIGVYGSPDHIIGVVAVKMTELRCYLQERRNV